jgi:hypothetical protein
MFSVVKPDPSMPSHTQRDFALNSVFQLSPIASMTPGAIACADSLLTGAKAGIGVGAAAVVIGILILVAL